jgi:hypothetical protein
MLHIIWLADAEEKIQILFRSISRRFRSDVYVRGIGLSRHQPIPNKQTKYFPINIRRTSGGDAAISVAGGSRSGLGALHSQRITDDWG